MTSDHHDPWHDAHRRDARPVHDPMIGDPLDSWVDADEWANPTASDPDDTTHDMRRPGSLFGAVGAWADRALSSGVEPTRSHRVVRPGDDRAPAVPHRRPGPARDQAPPDDQWRDDDRNDARRPDGSGGEERWDEGWDVTPARPSRSGVDPVLARLGALAVVATLLVPFLLGMRSGGDDGQLRDAGVATTAVVTTTDPPAGAPTTASASTSSAASSADGSAAAETAPAATAPVTSEAPAIAEDTDESDSAPAARAAALADDGATTASSETDAGTDTVAPACGSEYEVVAGDFWLRLADAAGVELSDLLAVNGATIDTPLFPGRSICLPTGARTPAPPTTSAPVTTAPATRAPTTAPPATAAPSTSPPTTAAPAPPPAPVAPGTVEQIIRDVWPDDLEERALEIAWRESNYVPTAKNFCCYGVFQIYWEVHRSWLADLGVTSAEQLYDPTINARAALALYQRSGGWGPWGF